MSLEDTLNRIADALHKLADAGLVVIPMTLEDEFTVDLSPDELDTVAARLRPFPDDAPAPTPGALNAAAELMEEQDDEPAVESRPDLQAAAVNDKPEASNDKPARGNKQSKASKAVELEDVKEAARAFAKAGANHDQIMAVFAQLGDINNLDQLKPKQYADALDAFTTARAQLKKAA